jgi:hypothetical protein
VGVERCHGPDQQGQTSSSGPVKLRVKLAPTPALERPLTATRPRAALASLTPGRSTSTAPPRSTSQLWEMRHSRTSGHACVHASARAI